MRAVDDAVIAAVEATGLLVHDADVPVDSSGQVVTSPLPYVVLYSDIGTDEARRLSGEAGLRNVTFQITYVGADRNQAKAAGQKARAVLADRRLSVGGLVRCSDSQRVRRDDDAKRPDGGSLFYGVDVYSVSVALTHS